MERSDYWGALARGWWLIVICGLGGLALGLVAPRHAIVTSFTSTSAVGSLPSAGPDSSAAAAGGEITADQIMYYATSDSVLAAAGQMSGQNMAAWVLRDRLTLLPPPEQSNSQSGATSGQPGVIDVTIGAPTPAQSLALNRAYDQALGDQINSVAVASLQSGEQQTEQKLASVEAQISSNSLPPGLTVQALQVQESALQTYLATLVVAEPNTGFSVIHTPVVQEVTKITSGATVNSRPLRATAGLLIGLAAGALLAVGMWLLDRRLKTARRAQLALGYPVVAEIPAESSDATEPYRMLWLSVFREPLPLPPADSYQPLYEGESPLLDSGAGSRSGPGTT